MNKNEFITYLKDLNIQITDEQLNMFDTYYKMLIEYNKVMNLTGITEEKDVYLKHFYDSLTLNLSINLENINTLCDMGSGAGFPGIPIKILFPNIKVTLIDSLQKRINFLNDVIAKLNLKDIEAIHTRIEDFKKREKYDLVVARAVAKTNTLIELAMPLTKINGYFIALKANINDELNNIDSACKKLNCKLDSIKEFTLPIENSKRTLIKFKKISKTDEKYPRKFEQIKKNPL